MYKAKPNLGPGDNGTTKIPPGEVYWVSEPKPFSSITFLNPPTPFYPKQEKSMLRNIEELTEDTIQYISHTLALDANQVMAIAGIVKVSIRKAAGISKKDDEEGKKKALENLEQSSSMDIESCNFDTTLNWHRDSPLQLKNGMWVQRGGIDVPGASIISTPSSDYPYLRIRLPESNLETVLIESDKWSRI